MTQCLFNKEHCLDNILQSPTEMRVKISLDVLRLGSEFQYLSLQESLLSVGKAVCSLPVRPVSWYKRGATDPDLDYVHIWGSVTPNGLVKPRRVTSVLTSPSHLYV